MYINIFDLLYLFEAICLFEYYTMVLLGASYLFDTWSFFLQLTVTLSIVFCGWLVYCKNSRFMQLFHAIPGPPDYPFIGTLTFYSPFLQWKESGITSNSRVNRLIAYFILVRCMSYPVNCMNNVLNRQNRIKLRLY